jgi:phenylacetate-CoA ligase
MNPFLNPQIIIPFIKNYLLDKKRLERLKPKQLLKYQDKSLRKIVKYAYTVPLYKQKFKDAGIHPNDIRGINDITKIPFTSRSEIREFFPNGIIPQNFNKEKAHVICTGGTTTKYCCNSGSEPVCTYTDISSILRGSILSSREYKYFNLNWKKTKFAHIGNFNPFKYDDVFENIVLSNAKSFFSFRNYLSIQASNHTKEIINKLEEFEPDVIISYPAIFQDIAYLKMKGYGKKINPDLLLVGGAMLDSYTRSYVENALKCRMFNTYASCESGAEIAFECKEGNWHIHSDFFHLEAVDENMEIVNPGERGRLVLSKLWGKGTPIVRYTGMEDWITLNNGEKCSCGLVSPIFGNPVEGRIMSNIILPNGKVFSPSGFLFINSVLCNLNSYKVRKYQIVQNRINEIDILIVIDEDLADIPPSFEEIARKIKEVYLKEIGPGVEISVKKVKEIKDNLDSGKPAPLVVSFVNQSKNCGMI